MPITRPVIFTPAARYELIHAQDWYENEVIGLGRRFLSEVEAWSIQHFNGSPVSFLLYTEDCDALYRRAIDAGATGFREPADQPYGDRMAGVKDPFGYRWFLATHIRDLSREELEAIH